MQHDVIGSAPLSDKPFANKRHFDGLNALRFLAAYLVVLFHGENIRVFRGFPGFVDGSLFKNGPLAVSFFFVLSGFLITFLLQREHDTYGQISVRRFYLRRVLRIMPLYYLLVLLGLVVIPAALPALGIPNPMNYTPQSVAWWYIFMMPFVVNIYYDVFVIGPLWSIGVEEFYYLFIAPVMRFAMRRIAVIFSGVIIAKLILLLCCEWGLIEDPVAGYIRVLAFEQMAIGGLFAWWLYHREKDLQGHVVWSRVAALVVYGLTLGRIFFHQTLCDNIGVYKIIMDTPVWSDYLRNVFFAWIIIDVAMFGRAKRILRSRVMERLGDISYGVYMYHNIVAFSLSFGLKPLWRQLPVLPASILYHILLVLLTVAVASVSKKYYENFFLGLKTKIH